MSVQEARTKTDAATEALWRIAETDDTGELESILASGAQIDASNAYGTTALMRAASKGRTSMVRTLLKHGADPNRSRNDKFTPLLLAAFFGHEETVKILAEHGAQIDAATRFGTSAWMWATSRTFEDVAHYLENPQGNSKPSKAKRAGETKRGDWNRLANTAVIARYGPRIHANNVSEAAVERARCLVGLAAPTAVKIAAQSVPEKIEKQDVLREEINESLDEIPVQEVNQREEVVQPFAPAPRSFRLITLSKSVYALTALLSVVALVGFTLQRKHQAIKSSAQTIPKAALDATTLASKAVTLESLPNGGAVPATTSAETKVDKPTVEKEPTSTYDKPIRVKPTTGRPNLFSAGARENVEIQAGQLTGTDVGPLEANPNVAPVEVRRTELPPVTLTTKPQTLPQPTVSSASPVKRIPPTSSQLITGSKGSSAAKGKVILWP